QLVALRQIGQCFGDARDSFHRAIEDAFGEPHHGLEIFRPHVALHQPPVRVAQITAKIERAIAVYAGVGFLDRVEHGANLPRCHGRVVQKVDELVEGALEIDIVLPQRVVCIDDEKLGRHLSDLGARRKGTSKTASTSTGTPSRLAGSNRHLARASAALRSRRLSIPCRISIASTWPSLRITANSRTVPSMRSIMVSR